MEQYSVIDAPLKKKAVQNDEQIDAVKLKGRKTFVLWITHLLNYHNTIDFLKYNEKKIHQHPNQRHNARWQTLIQLTQEFFIKLIERKIKSKQ